MKVFTKKDDAQRWVKFVNSKEALKQKPRLPKLLGNIEG